MCWLLFFHQLWLRCQPFGQALNHRVLLPLQRLALQLQIKALQNNPALHKNKNLFKRLRLNSQVLQLLPQKLNQNTILLHLNKKLMFHRMVLWRCVLFLDLYLETQVSIISWGNWLLLVTLQCNLSGQIFLTSNSITRILMSKEHKMWII